MDSKFDFGSPDRARTVYIRPVAMDSLPRDLRAQLPDVQTLYAVHDTDGERLALVQDRKLAFTLARQHELRPVSVH